MPITTDYRIRRWGLGSPRVYIQFDACLGLKRKVAATSAEAGTLEGKLETGNYNISTHRTAVVRDPSVRRIGARWCGRRGTVRCLPIPISLSPDFEPMAR